MCAHVCVYSIKSLKKKKTTRLQAKSVVNEERYGGSGGDGNLPVLVLPVLLCLPPGQALRNMVFRRADSGSIVPAEASSAF